jgi:hypothetical protein
MATYTIQAAGLRWLPGTVVGAYPQWSQPQQPPLGAPSGTPTATGTVTSLGVLVFTGLADDESYYAATSTGAGGYIAFTTSSGVATSSAVTISAALPPGTNNIGDVDVLSVPALFTDGTQKSKLVDTAGANVAAVSAAGRLSVDASGVAVTLAALPAGTNNIGDVDVLTLPALPAGTNTIGSVNIPSGAGRTLKFAVINTAASGDTQIAAAGGASLKHKVYAYFINAAGAVNVAFRSATTSISGLHRLTAAGDGVVAPGQAQSHYFETAANTILNVNLSAAVQVDGWIAYFTEA